MWRPKIARFLLLALVVGVFAYLGMAKTTRPLRDGILKVFSIMAGKGGSVSVSFSRLLATGSDEEIERREHERIQLLSRIAELEELKRENEVLRSALKLDEVGERVVLIARIIGLVHEGRDEFLILNKGARDGIEVGDVVLSGDGVYVGAIVDISENTAHAVLATSASYSTNVSVAGGLDAIAKGNNDRELVIELVPQNAEVRVGDLLVAEARSTGLERSVLFAEIRGVEQSENAVFKSVRAIHLFDPSDDALIVVRSSR